MHHASPSGGRDRARQLRRHLRMEGWTPSIGAAFLATSPGAQRWALQHLAEVVGTPLNPSTLKIVRPAVSAGVHEFTLLVADRGGVDPPAVAHFSRLGRPEIQARLRTTTPDLVLEAVAAAVRLQIDQDKRFVNQAESLHACLVRYIDILRTAIHEHQPAAPSCPKNVAARRVPDDVAPFLYHHLIQRFGTGIHQACVTVQALVDPAGDPSDIASLAAASSTSAVLRASDHLVFLHPTSFQAVPQEAAELATLTVHAGPVTPDELVGAYQSALLVARMSRLGWIQPVGPVTWQPPTSADMSAHLPLGLLEQLTPHLRPLLGAPLPQRLEMARTFHRVLAHSSSTLKEHAKALNISVSTLRHHLIPLEPVQHEPSSTTLIALASILPDLGRLWAVELSHHTRAKRRPTDRPASDPDGTATPPDEV